MKELVLTLLQAVLTATIPIVIAYLVSFLKKKSEQASAQIENECAKRYLSEITNAVTTAVSATSQTYVDALKKDNAFTKEAQLEALNKAKYTALSILSSAAVDFIKEVYGDIDDFLVPYLEEAVRTQKTEQGILLAEGIEIAEE